jgi:signal transduction histidine kinase
VLVNYIAARKVWIPFYRMLHILKRYRIDHAGPLDLPGTSLHEFEQLREALVAMSEKIRDDYRLMKEFNENAAHELQTPVAVIQSKIEMMMQYEHLPEAMVIQLNAALEAASRMSKMIQGLLLISRIGNNQFSLTEPTDVGSLVNRIIGRYDEMIEFRGISVNRSVEPEVILTINPTLADILVTNLVSNAIRYNLPGGTIRITVDKTGLVIANPGKPPRIAPADLFGRFARAGSDPNSSGLGLAIVKTIADLYEMSVDYTYDHEMHIVTLRF